MTEALVRYNQKDGVATVTLSRPSAGNAMNMALMDELYDAARGRHKLAKSRLGPANPKLATVFKIGPLGS